MRIYYELEEFGCVAATRCLPRRPPPPATRHRHKKNALPEIGNASFDRRDDYFWSMVAISRDDLFDWSII